MKRCNVKVTMVWDKEFNDIVERHMSRHDHTRTGLLRAVIMGLTDHQLDEALKRGEKLAKENRQKFLDQRREFNQKLRQLSPADLDHLLKTKQK